MNILVGRIYIYLKENNPSKINCAKNENDFRNHFAKNVCADIGLVRDVADAHKHLELTRRSRKVTSADQTSLATTGWGEEPFGESPISGSEHIVITVDDGSKRSLKAVLTNTVKVLELTTRRCRITAPILPM